MKIKLEQSFFQVSFTCMEYEYEYALKANKTLVVGRTFFSIGFFKIISLINITILQVIYKRCYCSSREHLIKSVFIVKSHKSPCYRYLQRDSHSFLGQFLLVAVRNYRRKASPHLCQQMDQNCSHLPTLVV